MDRVLPEKTSPQGGEFPPESELRDLVKPALRVGRRFIRQYGRIIAHAHHGLLQNRMVNYVVRRCRNLKASEA